MNAIKHVRKKLGFTQQQMAHCLGVSRAMVGHYEAGRKEPSTAVMIRLSHLENSLDEAKQKTEAKADAEDKLVNDHYERSRTNPDLKLRMHASRTAKLHRQYQAMKKKYAAIKSQLELTEKLSGKTKKGRTKENVFLDMLGATLGERFSKINPTKQLALRAKIMGRMREYEVLNGEV